MTNRSSFTPGPLSFDGFGINGGDEFKSRIATFVRAGLAKEEDKKYYGHLFAAAPELLEALRANINPVSGCSWDCLFLSAHGNVHSVACIKTRAAILKAEGKEA